MKIPDLAPPPQDRLPPPRFIGTAGLEVHVLELPADNVEKLQAVWQMLSATPIRLMSYDAFSQNSFRLLFGKVALWKRIQELLADADAQAVTTMYLAVPENDKADLAIAEIPAPRPITFVGTDLSQQTANVGAGVLVLRLWGRTNPWVPAICKITGCPAYAIPTSTPIPELQAELRHGEFLFQPASFACEMRPGDLLVLGPEKYTGERTTLGGLFFNKPDDALFFNPNRPKPPERKPAICVYVLLCTQVSGQ